MSAPSPRCPHIDHPSITTYYHYEKHGERRYCRVCREHKTKGAPLFPAYYDALTDPPPSAPPRLFITTPFASERAYRWWWYAQQRNPATRDWVRYFASLGPPPMPILNRQYASTFLNYLDEDNPATLHFPEV